MYKLENEKVLFGLSEKAELTHLVNKMTGHEYISQPRSFWKLIYRTTTDQEIPIFAESQTPHITVQGGRLCISYHGLKDAAAQRKIDLVFTFTLAGDELTANATITNNDDLEIVELWFPHVAGITSLGANPAQDALLWPRAVGMRIADPLHADFVAINGYRIYEMMDNVHRDLFLPYPGSAAMQWFELYNSAEGLYLASYDRSLQSTCLNAQQDAKRGTLGLGFIKYPLLKKGEEWTSAPFVVSPHAGDWHMGAKKYRAWADTWWKAPQTPDWMKDFTGWLRIILRHQYGEVLRDYAALPALYDESAAYGIKTIYILGWIPSGFSRLWPEYVPDPAMGGEEGLRAAIDAIHAKGGKFMMFVSSYLADRETQFYKQIGHKLSLKTFWGSEILFSETYTGEGSWRKILMGAMPLACMCPATPEWRNLLAEVGAQLTSYGSDGVLYDIGAPPPFLCFDALHPHAKPTLAAAAREVNFRRWREAIKAVNPNAIIAMEHPTDAFSQHVDLVQPAGPGSGPGKYAFPELYRYTFPEQILTNRECGEDETDYLTKANFTVVYGLRFDMTIFRCRGTLRDIPHYASYLGKLNRIREDLADLLLRGKFVDTDGFKIDNDNIVAKAYVAGERLAVVLWNATNDRQVFNLCVPGHVLQTASTVEGDSRDLPRTLAPNQVCVCVFGSQ